MSTLPNQPAGESDEFVAHFKSGKELAIAGELQAAMEHFRAALAINPRNSFLHNDLIYLMYFHPGYDDQDIFRELAIWERQHARHLAGSIRPHQNNRDPGRRLKIGYVSPEFRRQAEAFFVIPLLESHDHGQFEVHCYSSVAEPDDFTQRLQKCADVWHDVLRLNHAELAERIREDQIDILIDLSMHMRMSRMLTFARKPAPVQVTWLAYPGGTGLRTVDYRLTDRYFDPPGKPGWYTEESYRLPDCWVCFDPVSQSALATPRTGGAITFGSLNHPRKLNDSNLRLWTKIMRRVDGSRMILRIHSDQQRQRTARIFQEEGIAPERFEFLGVQPRWEYLRTYDRIDIALDTLPYNGITTTCDALWMGTPVVSLVGKTTAGRAGLGILSTIGLPELVANDPDQFIEIAVNLARDRGRLIEWRRNLRRRMESSPLMDAGRFARNVESAYRWMWQRWCSNPDGAAGSGVQGLNPALEMQVAVEHHQAGRLAEAEKIYHQILARQPYHAGALLLLGVLAEKKGQFDAAVELMQRAIRLVPDSAEAHYNLGSVFQNMDRLDEAIASFRQAIRLKPELTPTYNNLANALKMVGRLDEAIATFHQAIRLNPDLAEAHNNLGTALTSIGQLDEAIVAFRQAIRLKPDYADAQGNLIYALQFDPGCNAETIHDEHRRWNRQHAEPLEKSIEPHTNNRDPDRRLRIGYVSPDFRGHVVGQNLLPLLREHDHGRMEIFCYSNVVHADGITEQIKGNADVWRDIARLSDAQAADLIRQDRIDILVDLMLHSARNRLLVFARKPAPVQVTYLGYCGSTGLQTMDYRLSDPHLDPPDSDLSQYSERTIRLPETYWCYSAAGPTPEPSPSPAASAGCVTFGCLNNFAKVSHALELWAEILQIVPRSQLIIHSPPGTHLNAVRERFAGKGISPDRLEFPGQQPWPDYVRTYGRIDIALDPFPWSGGITTCDALWMGVPVVSLAGRTALGRGGKSILTNIGLPEFIAHSVEEYVSIAVSAARDLPRLAELRCTLRSRMRASPLMDAPRFARAMEAVYRQMWRNWCENSGESSLQ
jgi:predicted O-linked N-acetylglucosamine transferase (SPINDLY family)